MGSGRFDVGLSPVAEPASFGMETVEFRVATHPRQPLGPIARVASGGELARIALANLVANGATIRDFRRQYVEPDGIASSSRPASPRMKAPLHTLSTRAPRSTPARAR